MAPPAPNGDDETMTSAGSTGIAPVVRAPGAIPATGESVGRYVIEGVLGEGGMGVVLAAHDPDLDRRVALRRHRPRGPRSMPATTST